MAQTSLADTPFVSLKSMFRLVVARVIAYRSPEPNWKYYAEIKRKT
jgi:hypothetical protein